MTEPEIAPLSDEQLAVLEGDERPWIAQLLATISARDERIRQLEAGLQDAVQLLTECRSDYSYGGSGDVQEFLDGGYPALLGSPQEPPK